MVGDEPHKRAVGVAQLHMSVRDRTAQRIEPGTQRVMVGGERVNDDLNLLWGDLTQHAGCHRRRVRHHAGMTLAQQVDVVGNGHAPCFEMLDVHCIQRRISAQIELDRVRVQADRHGDHARCSAAPFSNVA